MFNLVGNKTRAKYSTSLVIRPSNPLTLLLYMSRRLSVPGRGQSCQHGQCFDLEGESLLASCRKQPQLPAAANGIPGGLSLLHLNLMAPLFAVSAAFIAANRRFGNGLERKTNIVVDSDGWQRADLATGWDCPVCSAQIKLTDLRFSKMWAGLLRVVPEHIHTVRPLSSTMVPIFEAL